MLVEYTNIHEEKYCSFLNKITGQNHFSYSFKNPFEYYVSDSVAEVKLWLLIVQEEVVASVTTKKQKYIVNGEEEDIYNIKNPISLAIVDREYNYASLVLISSIREQFKKSFLLGMGGKNSQVAKIFSKFDYLAHTIPFYVKPIAPIPFLLFNPLVQKLLDIDRKLPNPLRNELHWKGFSLKYVAHFDNFNYPRNYLNTSFSLKRTAFLLDVQAPNSMRCFLKLIVSKNGKDIGYITLFEASPRKHKMFGSINIWCLLDCFVDFECILPRELNKLLSRAARAAGVDALIMNTASRETIEFLRKSKWIKIRSNFAISLSPQLATQIGSERNMIITRLDGDGPINMGVSF